LSDEEEIEQEDGFAHYCREVEIQDGRVKYALERFMEIYDIPFNSPELICYVTVNSTFLFRTWLYRGTFVIEDKRTIFTRERKFLFELKVNPVIVDLFNRIESGDTDSENENNF
jgi:hypothetical protein